MLTLEQACTGLGVALADVLSHRIYPDKVVVVVKDGRKLTYLPGTEGTQGTEGTRITEVVEAETAASAPERKPRKPRGMSADISEPKEAHDA